ASGSPEERARSHALLSSARGAAEAMGMSKLVSDSRGAPDTREARKDEAGAQPASTLNRTCSIKKENDYWRLIYEDTSSTLRDRKGFTYLTHLLRNPGDEFASIDLGSARLNPDGTLSVIGQASRVEDGLEVVANLGDAGEILDARAIDEYKQRVEELRAEIDEAENFNDLGRVEKLKAELELYEDQITSGSGLNNRLRKKSS